MLPQDERPYSFCPLCGGDLELRNLRPYEPGRLVYLDGVPFWVAGILCSLANTRLRVVAALVSGAAAVVAYALPLKLNIVAAIAVAVLACFWLEGRTPKPPREQTA